MGCRTVVSVGSTNSAIGSLVKPATENYDLQLSAIVTGHAGIVQTVVEITQPCFYTLPDRVLLPQDGHQRNAFKEPCPCGTIAAYIDSSGDVKYCLFDEKTLGNVCNDPFLTVWNSGLAKEARKERCPLDGSGIGCSSFKILYSQFSDYTTFMRAYIKEVNEKNTSP